jgi:hypothetical protein
VPHASLNQVGGKLKRSRRRLAIVVVSLTVSVLAIILATVNHSKVGKGEGGIATDRDSLAAGQADKIMDNQLELLRAEESSSQLYSKSPNDSNAASGIVSNPTHTDDVPVGNVSPVDLIGPLQVLLSNESFSLRQQMLARHQKFEMGAVSRWTQDAEQQFRSFLESEPLAVNVEYALACRGRECEIQMIDSVLNVDKSGAPSSRRILDTIKSHPSFADLRPAGSSVIFDKKGTGKFITVWYLQKVSL